MGIQLTCLSGGFGYIIYRGGVKMIKNLILLTGVLVLLSSCSPAASAPVQTQPATDVFTATSTSKPPSRTPQPAPTSTLIVEDISTLTPAPPYVLVCVNVPNGGYYIDVTSQLTLHMSTLHFELLKTTGSFVEGQLPPSTLSVNEIGGGAKFVETETGFAVCQTAGACTATYESRILLTQVTCTL